MSHNSEEPNSSKTRSNALVTDEDAFIRFKGKIAFWWYALVVLIIGCSLGFLVQGVVGVITSDPDVAVVIVGALVFIPLDVLVIDSCIRNYVDFSKNSLTVRVALFSETIPYSTISHIEETNNALASLSTSLDRLLIRYRRYDIILISVKDKEDFLTEILKRNPQIQIERKTNVKHQ